MSKIIAVLGGGDWNDASVDHLILLGNVDLEKEKQRHEKWCREVYIPNLNAGRRPAYYNFTEWLVKEGLARKTTEDELIEIYE